MIDIIWVQSYGDFVDVGSNRKNGKNTMLEKGVFPAMNRKIKPMVKKLIVLSLLGLVVFYVGAQEADVKVGAAVFSITPEVGTPSGHSRTGHKIEEIHGDLKNTIIVFQQSGQTYCLFSSPLGVDRGPLKEFCITELATHFDIPVSQVTLNSSHNHTIPYLDVRDVERPESGTPDLLLWELGRDFIKGFRAAVKEAEQNMTSVSIEYGVAEETRITYNRKGIHLDGTTYFMREQDRLALKGKGYHGIIDPDAAVVVFKNKEKDPVAALSFYTGHPVAAYSPEKLISYGQFPQTASEILSDYLGGIPVAFLQGCGGNINAKHMLTGTMEQARELGEQLGESFIIASQSLMSSTRTGIEWQRAPVKIPLDDLPDLESLEQDLAIIDDFIQRGKDGDENTLFCVGLNFPIALTPPYRARLIELIRPWYVWGIKQHKMSNWNNIPQNLPIEILVARFGDVGFVGMPYEVFVETGLKIKENVPLPLVLTCGYTDGAYGYIPNEGGVHDMEYMSSNYRYRGRYGVFPQWKNKKDEYPEEIYSAYEFTPPYKAPAGDECANVAIEILTQLAR